MFPTAQSDTSSESSEDESSYEDESDDDDSSDDDESSDESLVELPFFCSVTFCFKKEHFFKAAPQPELLFEVV